MNWPVFIILLGQIVVLFYCLISIDDFIWDISTLFYHLRNKKKHIDFKALGDTPPKLLAMAIAAWKEDNVLEEVIDNIITSTMYPRSMYHIFLGIYPNDTPTLEAAYRLTQKHKNVHIIENILPGPTSKAQNINYVITQIKKFEQDYNYRFASLTVHDSEDVVHPYELKITNHLIDSHAALQFPVFPLLPMPTIKTYFSHLTANTYADEFAENHFTIMPNRDNMGAFVPSAGTGFALRRELLDGFENDEVLPKNSLTEDYRLALTLYARGIKMRYVLEKIPRVLVSNRVKYDFIATRSMFPNTFKTAVKQKTRWILGITLQSFKPRDIFKTKNISVAGRYSMYKDLKANVSNLFAFLGYPVLIYVILSFFINLPTMFPMFSWSWWLSIVVTILMLERQIMRGIAIGKVYGLRSVFFACLFPPLLPLRLVWGNLINFVATVRAIKQFIFGNKSNKTTSESAHGTQKKLEWSKTDHTFLEEEILKRYHRKLGDILLEQGALTTTQLEDALSKLNEKPLGDYCLEHHLITDVQFYHALAQLKHIDYISIRYANQFKLTQFSDAFDRYTLQSLIASPVLKIDGGYVFAFCEQSPKTAQTTLRELYNVEIKALFSTQEEIESAIKIIFDTPVTERELNPDPETYDPILNLYYSAKIDYTQAVLAIDFSDLLGKSQEEILIYMGLTTQTEYDELIRPL